MRDSERFTERLQEMADSAGIPVEVVNAGLSGDTSAGGLRRLDWVLQEPADVLVVELGANDGLRGQDVQAMKENLARIIERARELSPGVQVALAGISESSRGAPAAAEAMAEVRSREKQKLDRNISFLGTLGNNAPFIGLFGTVLGIIKAFNDLATNTQAGAEADSRNRGGAGSHPRGFVPAGRSPPLRLPSCGGSVVPVADGISRTRAVLRKSVQTLLGA